MKRNRFCLLSILIISISLFTQVVCFADDFVSSRVKDISDRSYEEAVIGLLDNAQKSIDISMYSISLGTNASNPVKLLLNDLFEARERNVEVTLYLNTRFRDSDKGKNPFVNSPIFKKLEASGVLFHFIPSNRRLHDKLIVVDSRYVVEGSANWSISALKNNFESSTLIDSPDLAGVKLSRLRNFLISSVPRNEKIHTPAYIENLPKNLNLSKKFLLNKKYLSRMVTSYDKQTMSLYLLLLAHSQSTGKQEFLISLEAMGLSLGMPASWTNTALRRQVIKVLKKLQKRYRLIEVNFVYSRDANVILTDISGDTFAIASDSLIQPDNDKLTMRLKFLLLIQALLKDGGENLYSMSQPAIAKRFNVSLSTIAAAFKDLEEYRKQEI